MNNFKRVKCTYNSLAIRNNNTHVQLLPLLSRNISRQNKLSIYYPIRSLRQRGYIQIKLRCHSTCMLKFNSEHIWQISCTNEAHHLFKSNGRLPNGESQGFRHQSHQQSFLRISHFHQSVSYAVSRPGSCAATLYDKDTSTNATTHRI